MKAGRKKRILDARLDMRTNTQLKIDLENMADKQGISITKLVNNILMRAVRQHKKIYGLEDADQ